MLMNYHIDRLVLSSLCVGDLVRLVLGGVRFAACKTNTTTCSYELFVVSFLVVAIVQPTSEDGTPMGRDYVVPMM